MSAQHTPGPWLLADKNTQRFTIAAVSSGLVATTSITKDSVLRETGLANAHLISAAPDLLEALEVALETLTLEGVCGKECLSCITARAAIAKARGLS